METPPPPVDAPADRIQRDVAWLADPAREGRGIGTAGLQAAGEYLEKRFAELGLKPDEETAALCDLLSWEYFGAPMMLGTQRQAR